MYKNIYGNHIVVIVGVLFFMVSCNNQKELSSSGNESFHAFGRDTFGSSYYSCHYTDTNNYEYDSLGISFFKKNNDEGRKNYKYILDSFSNSYGIKSALSVDELEEIMPKTRHEYAVYYKAFCKEKACHQKQEFLHHADSLIGVYGYKDSHNCFYILLNMFDMRDFIAYDVCLQKLYSDEYFENLFYAVDFATENNQKKFKKLFFSFDKKLRNEFECFYWETR